LNIVGFFMYHKMVPPRRVPRRGLRQHSERV
jgi:hypothetical protein